MTENNQHWRNQVEIFEKLHLSVLGELLNDFFKDKFVIATQIFPRQGGAELFYDAVVYYKVPPESSQ